jgi:hypothetical protein
MNENENTAVHPTADPSAPTSVPTPDPAHEEHPATAATASATHGHRAWSWVIGALAAAVLAFGLSTVSFGAGVFVGRVSAGGPFGHPAIGRDGGSDARGFGMMGRGFAERDGRPGFGQGPGQGQGLDCPHGGFGGQGGQGQGGGYGRGPRGGYGQPGQGQPGPGFGQQAPGQGQQAPQLP